MTVEAFVAIGVLIISITGATWKIGASIGGVRLEIQALRTEMTKNFVTKSECRDRHRGEAA